MTKEEITETYRRAWMSYFHPGLDREKDAQNRNRTTTPTFQLCDRWSIMYPNDGGHYGKRGTTRKVAGNNRCLSE